METAIIETKEIEKGVMDVTSRALALRVVDTATYTEAGQILVLHKDMSKKIVEYFKPLKAKSYDAWKAICTAENEELGKLQPGMAHLSMEMTAYNQEQEKVRVAEEERLRREALKREEDERLQAAVEAEREGNAAEAKAILEEPIFVPPPIVPKAVPKVNGLAQRTIWKFKIVNANLIPREYLVADEVKIGAVVRALKEKTNIRGIEAYPETGMGGARR